MKRVAVEIPVDVPVDVLGTFLKQALEEKSLSQAYFKLRGTTSPSRVVESTNRRIVLYEPTFDPSVKAHGIGRTGWTVTYELNPLSETETMVAVSVEYNRLTALLGFGLIKPQAENEVIQRIGALLAFEAGYKTDRTSPKPDRDPLLLEAGTDRIGEVRVPQHDFEKAARK